jgi:2-polyprenyl-3-methyl-5-hydroxy-6-metoxy-1,4-benzoquinol methylase
MECPLCNSTNTTSRNIGKYPFYTCLVCDLSFIPDFGNEHDYHKNYFDRLRVTEETMNSLRAKQYEIDARHFSKWVPQGSILDIGCSRGQFMEVLNRYGDYDCITGIDIDEQSIAFAKGNTKNSRLAFEATNLPSFIAKDSFDAVVFRGTLQYLSATLNQSFNKLKDIVKKDGLIVIYALQNANSFVFKLAQDNWSLFNPEEHKLFFSENAMQYLSTKYNLQIEEIVYPYCDTPYANIEKDYDTVIDMIKNGTKASPPFWGNIMQLVLRNK